MSEPSHSYAARQPWRDEPAVARTPLPAINYKAFSADVDELHARLIDQVPVIFTHNETDCIAHNKRVAGVVPWMSKLRLWEVSLAN